MAAVMADSSPRSWWFSSKMLSSSKSGKDSRHSLSERRPKSNGTKFNSLVSALGFKPKKQHPTLAIQDPPSVPVFPVQPPPVQPPSVTHVAVRQPANHNANRPPSNSVSSTLRSSLELRTPSDLPRDPLTFRQSLLTLSDSDPFASQGISSPLTSKPGPKSPIADTSTFESATKRFSAHFTVDSIPSVSSQTPPLSPRITSSRQADVAMASKSSLNSAVQNNIPSTSVEDMPKLSEATGVSGGDSHTVIAKSGSSSTLTDARRVINSSVSSLASKARTQPDVPKGNRTPPTREPSVSQKSVKFSPVSPTIPPTPGRPPVVRQLSASRIGKPPTAPPAQNLPPPPIESTSVDDLVSFILPPDSSPSSSLLSFTSSLYPDCDDPSLHPFHPHRVVKAEKNYVTIRNISQTYKLGKDVDQSSSPSPKPERILKPRNIKKAASHHSFSSKRESVSSICTPEEALEKHPRKHRSFNHNTRLPNTQRHASPQKSSNFASFVSHMDFHDIGDRHMGNIGGTSTSSRKRFFSGTAMRRPATSHAEHDPDVRSVLSLPLENERTQAVIFPTAKAKSVTSSIHESIRDEPAPPPGSPEYVPQHILSPAEMLRVEASIEAGTDEYLRGRRSRVPSTSTTHSTKYPSDMFSDFSFPGGLSPAPSIRASVEQPFSFTDEIHTLSRSSSITRSKEPPSLRIRTRLSTSQPTMTSTSASSLYSSPVAMEPSPVSLPPPPRPRIQQPSTSYDHVQRPSVVPYVPLSPPPARKNLRSKSSLESVIMRRSIMKKPSFLEIEDDVEKDGERPGDSFLDLNRESFDTLRSFEPDGLFQQPLTL